MQKGVPGGTEGHMKVKGLRQEQPGSVSRLFFVGEIEEERADGAHHAALYAICFLLPFSPINIRRRNVSVILANHTEPCRARAALLFENTVPTGRPLHGKNRYGKSGYDGYVTRMFSL
ncbi:hypothetical protein [Paenibacillus odorifer]|uniref:hypothetical protein n=2 Tax=Paenibacillus TaxID=44249 RepID=UPI001C4B4B3C|nr:hypothetical protein [Paenibacillus odorifer]